MLLCVSLMSHAFVNEYTIVGKIEDGEVKEYQGKITLTGSKQQGLVSYQKLTIHINDLLNYQWTITDKTILDENTVQLKDDNNHKMSIRQRNDSVFIFTLPLFYGNHQGVLRYKTIYRSGKLRSEATGDALRETGAALKEAGQATSTAVREKGSEVREKGADVAGQVGEKLDKAVTAVQDFFRGSRTDRKDTTDAFAYLDEVDLDDDTEESARADAQAAAEKAATEAAEADADANAPAEEIDPRTAKAQNAMQGLFGKKAESDNEQWQVYGRKLIGEIEEAEAESESEGVVVVAIRVDQQGNVVSATRGAGTTTDDAALIQAACASARKAKFTKGEGSATGTITYVFRSDND